MNLYLARLQDHGVSQEAVEIGKQLGKQVILMSTSTGGTMSLYLAQEDPAIYSLTENFLRPIC